MAAIVTGNDTQVVAKRHWKTIPTVRFGGGVELSQQVLPLLTIGLDFSDQITYAGGSPLLEVASVCSVAVVVEDVRVGDGPALDRCPHELGRKLVGVAREVCEELAVRGLPLELSTMGLNPAGVTPELIQAMKRAGFKNVMCTPESASESMLKSLNKGFHKHAVVRAAKALREAGMPTYWFFMLGAPGETMNTVRETLEFCEEHVPPTDMVLFSTGIRVYAGTPLERTCKDMGWFAENDPLFEPSWFLSPKLDLNELYGTLVKAAQRHPNWMTNAETVMSPAMAATMKQAFRMLGWKGPFWTHLPRLFSFVGKLGIRKKGLELHAETVRRITDVAHHS